MTTRFVKWCTFKKLPCTNAAVQDVVLCLQSSELVVQPDPPCGLEISTIEATICQGFTLSDACLNPLWNYTFSYDDTQLANPSSPLVTADITGVFCRDCLTTYIDEQISCAGGGSVCVTDSNTIDFSLTEDGCVTGDVKISADEGNIISAHSDGIYAAGGGGGGNDWHILGNSDIVDGTNFLGTTNDVPVTFRSNNIQCGKFYPGITDGAPSFAVGTSISNIIDANSQGQGCSILGGGHHSILNDGGDYANFGNVIVGGGNSTIKNSSDSVIGGGFNNFIDLTNTFSPGLNSGVCVIAGGDRNEILAEDQAFIGGGVLNIIDGNFADDSSFAHGDAIVGGSRNFIDSTPINPGDQYSLNFIGGGDHNIITASNWSVIVGGRHGFVTDTSFATISGGGVYTQSGNPNFINGQDALNIAVGSTIGGGAGNRIDPDGIPNFDDNFDYGGYSTISGGGDNIIKWQNEPSANGAGFHAIGGGQSNMIIRAGGNATIAGGFINEIVYGNNMITGDDSGFATIDSDVIAGGNVNLIIGNPPVSPLHVDTLGANFIGGGETNEIDNGIRCVIGGGWDNGIFTAGGNFGPYSYQVIGGGTVNLHSQSQVSFIGGGMYNELHNDTCSVIVGGYSNYINGSTPGTVQVDSTGAYGTINPSTTANVHNAILGGVANQIATGFCSSILGGAFLKIGASSFGYQSPATRSFSSIVAGTVAHGATSQVDVSAFSGIGYLGDVDLWIGNTDSTARKVKFFEPNSATNYSGTNFSSFRAQAQSADIEYIWPASAGTAGQQLTIDTVVGTVVTLKWA